MKVHSEIDKIIHSKDKYELDQFYADYQPMLDMMLENPLEEQTCNEEVSFDLAEAGSSVQGYKSALLTLKETAQAIEQRNKEFGLNLRHNHLKIDVEATILQYERSLSELEKESLERRHKFEEKNKELENLTETLQLSEKNMLDEFKKQKKAKDKRQLQHSSIKKARWTLGLMVGFFIALKALFILQGTKL